MASNTKTNKITYNEPLKAPGGHRRDWDTMFNDKSHPEVADTVQEAKHIKVAFSRQQQYRSK